MRDSFLLSSTGFVRSLLLICILVGCGDTNWKEMSISPGQPLLERFRGADTAVVLVYDPADCFTCYGSLQPWIEWGRERPGAFGLVLTREPSPTEARGLTLYRIRYAGILAGPRRIPRTPVELLIVDGKVERVAFSEPGSLESSLYRELKSRESRPPGRTTISNGERR